MDLEEKQTYYHYGDDVGKIRFKEPPILRPDVVAAMDHYKLNDDYRFVWMGVDVERKAEVDPKPVVRGDERAAYFELREMMAVGVKGGRLVKRLTARKLFIICRQETGFSYINLDGHRVKVARWDQLPAQSQMRTIPVSEYLYHDFGALEWQMQFKLTGEEAVMAGLFHPLEEVPDVYWQCIQTIGRDKYQEPSLIHVTQLREREHQNRNEQLDEVVKFDIADRRLDHKADAFKNMIDERVEYLAQSAEVIDWNIRKPHTVNAR